ncbi:hypothetical protein Dimus_029263 [Dionaea muscipula]
MLLLLSRFLGFHILESIPTVSLSFPRRALTDSRRRGLAPPTGSRRREGAIGDWEDWLRTYSDPFACKERAVIRNHRFLKKMVNQAKTEDGELRERLGCRRSSRISPSISSAFSDLGVGRASGLPTVVEHEVLMGCPADETSAFPLCSELGFARVSEAQSIEECFESEDERGQMVDREVVHVRFPSSGRGKGSGFSPVADSDCLEGDLTEVQGGPTPSMVSDALAGAQDSDSFCEEVGGHDSSIVTVLGSDSSTAPVLGNSAMELQISDGDAQVLGDIQVSHICSSLVSESLEALHTATVDLHIAKEDLVSESMEALHTAKADLLGEDSGKVDGEIGQGGGGRAVKRQDDDLMVGGVVVDGQQVPLAAGVALRLPSTDGRQ